MATRRMFSKKITDSDAFTDMPLSAQCLYFHISMNADDDGFVEGVNRIRRSIGASEDDLKLLFAKSFLIPFESGVVVVRQWRIHNYIQKDRYTPTTHVDELARLTIQDTGEKGAYALIYEQISMPIGTDSNLPVHGMDTECIHDGYTDERATAQTRTLKDPVITGDNKNVSRMDTACIQSVSAGIGKGIGLGTGLDIRTVKKGLNHDNDIQEGLAGARTRTRENTGSAEDDGETIGSDGNWERSTKARAATAQIVVDRMTAERLEIANYNTVFDIVFEAMDHHIPPDEILKAARQLDMTEFVLWKGRMQERMDEKWRSRTSIDHEAYEARRREWERGSDKTPEELERLRLAYSGLTGHAAAPDYDDPNLPY